MCVRWFLSAVILVACVVSTSIADAQIFRRNYSRGVYYEMGCDCRHCVANRGGRYADVYGRRTTSDVVVAPPKNPSAPSPTQVILLALEIADVKPHDVLYDIGSGDGRVIEIAARDFGCKSVGFEIDEKAAEQSSVRLRGILPQDTKWNIVTGDATTYNLSQATVAYLYLYPEDLARVVPRLKGCTRIISYMHPVPGYDNQRYETDNGPIYLVGWKELAASVVVTSVTEKKPAVVNLRVCRT